MKYHIEITRISKKMVIAILAGVMISAPVIAIENTADQTSDQSFSQRTKEMSEEASKYFKDGWVEGKIETAILLDDNLNPFNIDASVNGSSVTLEGTVSSEIEKDLAEEISRSVEGISEVDNQLQIVADTETEPDNQKDSSFQKAVKDASITAEVKIDLLANDSVSGLSIDVDTKDQVVTLSGEVDSEAVKDLAEKIASNVEKVHSVENKLMIN